MALFKKSGAVTLNTDRFGGLDCTKGITDSFFTSGYMRNFTVTRDGMLKKRYGYKKLLDVVSADTYCSCKLGNTEYFIFQSEDFLIAKNPYTNQTVAYADTGIFDEAEYFVFNGLLYIFGGEMFYTFNGSTFEAVQPYIPTVAVTVPNSGGGVIHESLNLLGKYAAVTCSPDGISADFILPTFAYTVTKVELFGVEQSGYTYDYSTHKLTLSSVPPSGTPDCLKVTFRLNVNYIYDRDNIGTRFCIYGGKSDTRVFFYGNSNRIYYSDVTDAGADVSYIAAENFITVGDGTYNVTALVQNYDRLIVFTPAGSWYISPATVDYDGYSKPAFPIFPLNDKIGCKNGAAVSTDNSPLTLTDGGIFRYTSSSVRDERNAVCVSERVMPLLTPEFINGAVCLDNEANKQVWFAYDGLVIVYDYANDVFYCYDGIDAESLFILGGEVAFFSGNSLYVFDPEIYTDDGQSYTAVWESGYCRLSDGEKPRKLRRVAVSLVPESGSDIRVTVMPNRGKSIDFGQNGEFCHTVPDFSNINFGMFSFECEGRPKTKPLRCKTSPFEYLKLRLYNNAENGRATVAGIMLCAE